MDERYFSQEGSTSRAENTTSLHRKRKKSWWIKKAKRHPGRFFVGAVLLSVLIGGVFASLGGIVVYIVLDGRIEGLERHLGVVPSQNTEEYSPQTSQEQRIIEIVKQVSPAVVSIVTIEEVPVFEDIFIDPFDDSSGGAPFRFRIPERRQSGTERRETGEGSGFIISPEGLVVTNKHVVLEEDAEYVAFANDGESYPVEVLARDPVQDIAILRIENPEDKKFPFVPLGNSSGLQIGQTVIAIGNALGEFRNTVSVGVISGLGRTITASDGGAFVETIEDVIQTDTAINRGNSGGPLLNLAGEVIGVNTATVLDAQNIGFSIPVDKVVRDVNQVQEIGRIVYPFLGIRYTLVTKQLQESRDLPVDYGAYISSEGGNSAIVPGSGADKAGLQEEDIIVELNGERITLENSLAKIIQQYDPGDIVELRIYREGSVLTLQATLGERDE